jgi:uncharacterized protein (DUF2147 family)
MKKIAISFAVIVAAAGFAASAHAAGMADMVGKWKWTDFTVECKEGGANGMSCLVIDGPKNKGMEMVQSKLEAKGADFVGKIKHPASGDIYNTKMSLKDANTWVMDGCTDAGVCAKGEFTRIK